MKILKGIFKFIIGLLVVAAGIMLYAENANYTLDKEKAADYVTKNAEVKSRTWCAWYVMRALQEGGCPIYLLPAYGYSWLLPRMDFVEVSKENLELLREELSSEVLDIIPISANENNLGDLPEIIRQKVAENRNKKVVY